MESQRAPVDEVEEQVLEIDWQDELSGRGDSFRVSKPDASGLTQYVWRMARFHAGHDTSMPVTAAWWLQDWLDENDIDASVSGVTDDAGTEVTEYLDMVAQEVLEYEFGMQTDGAARAWSGIV